MASSGVCASPLVETARTPNTSNAMRFKETSKSTEAEITRKAAAE
jgi:hypothetical protein